MQVENKTILWRQIVTFESPGVECAKSLNSHLENCISLNQRIRQIPDHEFHAYGVAENSSDLYPATCLAFKASRASNRATQRL